MYIANEDELALRDKQFEEQAEARKLRRGDSDDEDESGDESGDDEEGNSKEKAAPDTVFKGVATMKTKNPNAGNDPKIAPKMMKLKDLKSMGDALPAADPEAGMTRKQREELEAERKKAEYLKRRMAGETPEAKKDLERLKEVRARRAEQAKKREEEGRAPGWVEEAEVGSDSDSDSDDSDDSGDDRNKGKKKSAAGGKTSSSSSSSKAKKEEEPVSLGAMSKELADKKKKAALAPADEPVEGADLPVLKGMDIKKMNPNELKDHLKARNLPIQGAKKDLMKRLQDHEATRG